MTLPNGELPLRRLLRMHSWPGSFKLLRECGAKHDIITACAAADVEAVKRLLDDDPRLVHTLDEEGNTPLHWACVNRYPVIPAIQPVLVYSSRSGRGLRRCALMCTEKHR